MSQPAFSPIPPSEDPVVLDRDLLGRLACLNLTGTALRVLLILLKHHDPETGTARLSQQEIADGIGTSRQGVNRAIMQLSSLNLITDGKIGSYTLNAEVLRNSPISPIRPVPLAGPSDSREERRETYRNQTRALLRAISDDQ